MSAESYREPRKRQNERKYDRLGKMQTLTVLRIKEFGVYLGHEGEKESVLLPRKQVPQGTKEGDEIEVFVYKDSMDRIILQQEDHFL
mgnify:CR=1 FL=1